MIPFSCAIDGSRPSNRGSGATRFATALMATASIAAMSTAQAQTAPRTAAEQTAANDAAGKPSNEEIIVTGVGVATVARKANTAYSVLTEEDMAKFTPISADDMLRDMPGVVVESNDGVARNEVFTRGMTIGTGSNTSGYFWTTILEDGLPVVPFKFGGFQDGYFYRADISTSRVESVRGGSSATAVSTSVGATFNYISGPVKEGAAIQARIGFEGEDSHLSWKQLDAKYGWLNKAGDFGIGVSGFYRTSNGQVNPGYNLNKGGQFRIRANKDYQTDSGSGSFLIGYKHLDDTNAELTAFQQPAYSLANPEEILGFGRDANLFLKGGQQTVPNYFEAGSHSLDPSKGFRYKQDAGTLNWNHSTDNGWNFSTALRVQKSTYRGQGYKTDTPVSLASAAAARDRFGLNINNLDRTPGFYEFRDGNGALVARVANNVNGSQLGTNYRTGAACPRVTATTFQSSNSLCVTMNELPNANLDARGGSVTASNANNNGTFTTAVLPVGTSSQDLVLRTRVEDTYRSSSDIMINLGVGRETTHFAFNAGIYFARSNQVNQSWANGQGISAWADGQVENLNVSYVTQAGTTYQLTDPGGWGNYGSGLFSTVNQHAKITEIAPRAEFRWSPNSHWDFNASVKYDHFAATTNSVTYDTRNSGATSLTNGGLDNNPLTLYDNFFPVVTPSKVITAKRTLGVWNFSGAIGYNINANHKFYVRYTDGKQPSSGIVQRYTTPATLVRPLGPTAYVKGYEIAYNFNINRVSGAVTYFKQNFAVNDYPFAIDTDNVTTYLLPENFNTYFTRGVEAWAKWRVTNRLEWSPSVTFLNGRTTAAYNWLNTGANGQGAADDQLRIDSGGLARSPKWTISNVVSYKLGDFRLSLRHRWMSERRFSVIPLDLRTLPKQDNLDASIQYEPSKGTRVIFDVRNVANKQYISAYDALLQTNLPSGIQAYDVVQQLPESLFLLRRNPPRSFWLTVRHEM